MSKLLPLAIIALTAAPVHADPTTEIAQLIETARSVATAGRCRSIGPIGRRVRELDPAYYSDVFARDPVIAACIQTEANRPQPALAPLTAPAAPSLPADPADEKSGTVAFLASALTTAGGYGLLAVGEQNHSTALADVGGVLALVGPTVGHTYSGKTWNDGLSIRLVGLGLTVIGAVVAIDDRGTTSDGAAALLIGGSVTTLVGTLYEIGTASEAAHEYNRARGYEPVLTFAPIKARDGATPGLAFACRF